MSGGAKRQCGPALRALRRSARPPCTARAENRRFYARATKKLVFFTKRPSTDDFGFFTRDEDILRALIRVGPDRVRQFRPERARAEVEVRAWRGR
jgi:hypothetical protein